MDWVVHFFKSCNCFVYYRKLTAYQTNFIHMKCNCCTNVLGVLALAHQWIPKTVHKKVFKVKSKLTPNSRANKNVFLFCFFIFSFSLYGNQHCGEWRMHPTSLLLNCQFWFQNTVLTLYPNKKVKQNHQHWLLFRADKLVHQTHINSTESSI